VPVAAIEDDGTILYSILTCSLPDAGVRAKVLLGLRAAWDSDLLDITLVSQSGKYHRYRLLSFTNRCKTV
jgi:hypothetical protein